MAKYIIEGKHPIQGEINVNGAKNAALKIIPASILSDEKITINNLPLIEDVEKALNVLVDLGAQINKVENTVSINTKSIKQREITPELAKKFRASIMFIGPLLARFGEVKFPHPGGCVIGTGGRPIDLFIDLFKALGASVKEEDGYYNIKANKLKGCEFFFPLITVTGTESAMMTATLANGTTILKNCALEPEISVLAEYLNKQGAKISGAGTPTITIEGVKKLHAGIFEIIPDRIETASFAILAAANKADLLIKKCNPEHIEALLFIFKKIGINYEKGKDWLHIKKAKTIEPYSIKTHEYPGFVTDIQSPYTVLMTQANGSSMIHETIYDRRLLFVDLLSQMGANITMCDPHRVVVNGPTKLYAKKLTSPDLRAGISLVIAATIAEGETEIDSIYQIERGYEDIAGRLSKIGVKIQKID